MTGIFNNAQFRTDQWQADLQLRSDAMRQNAMQHGVGMAVGTARHIGNMRMQNQQFQQDYALKKAETDARLQLMEQERQENSYKLQALGAVDIAKRSFEETRAMKLGNDRAEAEFKYRQKQIDDFDQDTHSRRMDRAIDAAGGHIGLAAKGKTIEVGPDGKLAINDDEEGAQRVLESRFQGGREGRYAADGARRAYAALQSRYFDSKGRWRRGLNLTEDQKREIQQKMQTLEGNFSGYYSGQGGQAQPQPRGYEGQPVGPPDGTPVNQQVQPQSSPFDDMTPGQQQMVGVGYNLLQEDGAWRNIFQQVPDQSKVDLLRGIGRYAADLVEGGQTVPELVPTEIMDALNGNGMMTAYFLSLADITPARIRATLRARGQKEPVIESIMKRLDKHANKK